MKVGIITMTVFKNKETGRWEIYARYKNYKKEKQALNAVKMPNSGKNNFLISVNTI